MALIPQNTMHAATPQKMFRNSPSNKELKASTCLQNVPDPNLIELLGYTQQKLNGGLLNTQQN